MPASPPTGDSRTGPTPETMQSILMAGFRVLMSEGIVALTPSRLHQETGVARTTIYRHWPDRLDIVADLLAKATERSDLGSYIGELDQDLRTAVATLTWRFANRPLRQMLGACVAADRAGDHRQSLASEYVEGLIAPIVDVVTAAQERGEMIDGDPQAFAAELSGPLLVRHVFLGEDPDEAEVEALIERFLTTHRR